MLVRNKYPNSLQGKALHWMLLCYMFVVPFGTLGRFSQQEGALGVSSILLLGIVLFSLPHVLREISTSKNLQVYLAFILWIGFASLFSPDISRAIRLFIYLLLYFAFSISCFLIVNNRQKLVSAIAVFLFSCLLGSALTIFDFTGWINFDFVNSTKASTETSRGLIVQASGLFPRRTAMAAYYLFAICFGLSGVFLLGKRYYFSKVFLSLTALFCFFALVLTHNRASIIASIFALLFFILVFGSQIRGAGKRLFLVIVAGAVIYLIWIYAFPETVAAYLARFGAEGFAPVESSVYESDFMRIKLFGVALRGILLNPIGHGYSLIELGLGSRTVLIDPHNGITQIIWGGGLFGVLILLFGAFRLKKFFKFLWFYNRKGLEEYRLLIVISSGLVGFILFNLAHSVLSIGVAYAFMGFGTRLYGYLSRTSLTPRVNLD